MMEFLEFINKADADTLKKVPGITPPQAKKLIAARPFASLEDCARVKGFTQKRLDLLAVNYQEMLEADKSTEKPAIAEPVKVEDESSPVTEEEKPVRKNRAGRVIAWIVVLLLLAAAVFAVIKWVIPYVNEKYIKPVENNTASITDLASQQNQAVKQLNDQLIIMQTQIVTLESRADAVDQSLKTDDETLTRLQNMQDQLSQQLATQKSDLLQDLSTQIALTRGVDLLSRSRLYLSESNFGLAKIDLQTSRDLLYSLLGVLPADQINGMKMVISRIDMALQNLPTYPVIAVYDVDTAWQLLIDGLPNIPAQAVTPVVLPPTETPAPTATAEVTPAATLQATATANP